MSVEDTWWIRAEAVELGRVEGHPGCDGDVAAEEGLVTVGEWVELGVGGGERVPVGGCKG